MQGPKGITGATGPSGSATGPAGGDLSGTYPDPSIADGVVTLAKLAFDPATQDEFDAFTAVLALPGSVNDPGNPVQWTRLKGVPAGFADGRDDITDRAQPPAAAGLARLDNRGNEGQWNSVTIGADGLPLISYVSRFTSLRVTHCENRACSQATSTTLDGIDFLGFTSVTIGADGLALISYEKASTLKVAHCNNLTCSSATTATLDSGFSQYSSVMIGSDGLGLISYQGTSGLKIAHCANLACSSATTATLDSFGLYPSVATGLDGLGLIAYYDPLNADLKLAHCADLACGSATSLAVDASLGDVGQYPSITIAPDGSALISYFDARNFAVKVAHCQGFSCPSTRLDTSSSRPGPSSITIGSDGLPVISYYGSNPTAIKVAHCADLDCKQATKAIPDPSGFGYFNSVTIGADGLPLIAYGGVGPDNSSDLRVAHCSNTFCAPYFRRR